MTKLTVRATPREFAVIGSCQYCGGEIRVDLPAPAQVKPMLVVFDGNEIETDTAVIYCTDCGGPK